MPRIKTPAFLALANIKPLFTSWHDVCLTSGQKERLELIRAIEEERKSRVVEYWEPFAARESRSAFWRRR